MAHGSGLVVEQVQVALYNSHEHEYHLFFKGKPIGYNSMNQLLVNQSFGPCACIKF